MLYLDPDKGLRLKSFSSSSRGDKGLIKLEIEVNDLSELGFELSCLQRQMAKQKAADLAKREAAKARPKLLALPKPEAD
jgi:hypothetical protein